MMSIDEAIEHAREVADKNSGCWKHCNRTDNDCDICEEEHEQLAEWLEELKSLREAKELWEYNNNLAYQQGRTDAIDDFVKMLKGHHYTSNFDWEYYDEIAEQLKEGGENESK